MPIVVMAQLPCASATPTAVANPASSPDVRVGRKHRQHGFGACAPQCHRGAETDGGSGVARGRLRDDVVAWESRQRAPDLGLLIGGSDDQDPVSGDETGGAPDRRRQQRLAAAEPQQLLGPLAAVGRPKPGSSAASENDGGRRRHTRATLARDVKDPKTPGLR